MIRKLIIIAIKSAWNRKISLFLASFSIAVSIALILIIDNIRREAKENFTSTISGTDLIVGAKGSPVNLLLYSVFHIGEGIQSISYQTFLKVKEFKNVRWTIPLSLGDSHQGYRVLGTSKEYFDYFRYQEDSHLGFVQGKPFHDLYDVVIGSEVARNLNYLLQDKIVIAHGLQPTEDSQHNDKPFKVSGILKPTGTPVDRTLYVSLEGLEAIHIDWVSGVPSSLKISAAQARNFNLTPKNISAIFMGTKNIVDIFRTQKAINDYEKEPLIAILPGVTLSRLWHSLGFIEKILLAISGMVLLAGIVGLITTLIATVNERMREIAILRSVGMFTYQLLFLFAIETCIIVLVGCLMGIFILFVSQIFIQPVLLDTWGVNLNLSGIYFDQITFLIVTIILSTIFSIIPSSIAYRKSIANGLLLK